jgi:hypothetical protein
MGRNSFTPLSEVWQSRSLRTSGVSVFEWIGGIWLSYVLCWEMLEHSIL